MYKMIIIEFDSVLEQEIADFLKENRIFRYFNVVDVQAGWSEKMRHLNSHTWPGTDNLVHMIVENERAKEVFEKLRKFKNDIKENVAFGAFIMPVDDMI